jgi:hypothetical protein
VKSATGAELNPIRKLPQRSLCLAFHLMNPGPPPGLGTINHFQSISSFQPM